MVAQVACVAAADAGIGRSGADLASLSRRDDAPADQAVRSRRAMTVRPAGFASPST